MPYVIGIDVGGTFTDAVASDETGRLIGAKVPSTPPDYARGVIATVEDLARQLELPVEHLLGQTAYIAHGTTATINALVTGNVASVGFLTTKGHADSIHIMNVEGRYRGLPAEKIQDVLQTAKPPALVPKSRTRGITERIDYSGAVVVPLDEDDARQAIRELLDQGVKAIAVSLLWSFVNPVHEQRLRELIRELDPDVEVVLSSEVSPRIREFARNATTIMSSQVAPTLRNYLGPLQDQLRRRGLNGPLLVMQASGGTINADEASENAITTVGSVLTGGVVGSQRLAERLRQRNVIATDVGGTTFLVGLIVDGEPVKVSSTIINQHPVNVPSLRVDAIGSGGGAVAWIDHGGNLRVGPKSAAADPGPACYAQGGEDPTVTDADLVLGILNEDFFLGGAKKLSRELAERALLEKIGKPLGLDAEQAAAAVFAVQNAQTADLIRRSVVEAGHDPRDFVMYSFGGAGPVHCHAYGADLGISEIIIPLGAAAAAFSAFGLAASDLWVSSELSDPQVFPVPADRVRAVYDQVESTVRDKLVRQNIAFAETSVRRELDARYASQLFEVTTAIDPGPVDEAAVAGMAAAFERTYADLFGEESGFKALGVQFITYRAIGTGALGFKAVLPDAPEPEPGHSVADALKGHRPVQLDLRRGYESTAVYDYRRLRAGDRIDGPAVVEVPTTTVAIPSDSHGVVDALGNLVLRYEQGSLA